MFLSAKPYFCRLALWGGCVLAGVFAAAAALAQQGAAGGSPTPSASDTQAEQAQKTKHSERFAALEKSLSDAVLVGQFSQTGAKTTDLQTERYELASVRHLSGDMWLFNARIRYGDHDVTVPLSLPVRWAGDTPVISLDTVAIPGLGTYTARVLIYADHYAGFWSGGDHGGHLFGVVERPDDRKASQQKQETGRQPKAGS